MAVAPSLSVVAKMAAPCCTSAVQMAVSLHDAAQCNGVLGVEACVSRRAFARVCPGQQRGPAPHPRSAGPVRVRLRAHQPWLSGELTLAPAAMRKSTMG